MVRNSDIRFATNGIEVLGMPGHSPLLGDAGETNDATNNTGGGAQFVGNVMNTDRGSLSVAGSLSSLTDVDFFRFELDYDLIQSLSATEVRSLATIFDIDYADGLGRPDTTISVYQEVVTAAGPQLQLILLSRDSNITDDQGAELSDLTRGSADNWTLEDLLNNGPALLAGRTVEEQYLSAAIGAVEMLKTGCTSAYDLFMALPAPTPDGCEAVRSPTGRG